MTYENYRSYQRYKLVHDQIRVDFGQIIALDLGAITTVFMGIGITGIELEKELGKMRLFHEYIVKKKGK